MSAILNGPRAARAAIFAVVAFLAPSVATQAAAAIIETSTITNSYSYQIGTESGTVSNAGPVSSIFANNVYPGNGAISEGALQLTSFLDAGGNFYFLHNGYCHGICDISITTEILFTIQNTGPTAVDLRFDTQITPGHVARNNTDGSGDSGGLFQFSVVQDPGAANDTLFSANGFTGTSQPGVETSNNSVFNGFNSQNVADPNFAVTDWSATNLNLQLSTLAAGATTTVRYRSTLSLLNNADCRGGLTSSICAGFQVAFGDPRNKGGATADLTGFRGVADALGLSDATDGPLPAVGGLYDAYRVVNSFVPIDTPLPATPPVISAIPYNTGYEPAGAAAVPEPASWAMMIVGFVLVGGRLRARQGRGAQVTARGRALSAPRS